jgi:hypothetical protein
VVEPVIKHISVPQVARAFPWNKTKKNYSFTTTSDQLEYSLPYDFEKMFYLKSKYGRLTELTPTDFHFRFPDRSERLAQDIGFYCIEEFEGVQNQIVTAEKVTVVSDSAADTTLVLIRGEVDGYDDYEEVTVSGVIPVETTKTFSHIAYVTKSAASLGRISVTGSTSSTVLTKISPEHLTAQYKRLLLDSNPQESLTLACEYLSLIFKPVRDYDVFRVPADLVLLNALALLGWERRDVTNQLSIEKKYQTELAMAIRNERKSYSINSKMELTNESRKFSSEDNPISDIF